MSLLSTESLSVFLAPTEVVAVRWRGLPRQIVDKRRYAVSPGDGWTGTVEAFALALREAACRRVRVTLSAHFTQCQVVPWRADLKDQEEELAVVHLEFVRIYGDSATRSTIRLSDEIPGRPRVAAAIDGTLLEALAQAAKAARARLVSIQPCLIAAVNRWRRHFPRGRSAWLVLLEDTRASMALIEDTRWSWVRSMRLGSDDLEHLPELVEHEILLAGSDTVPDDILVFAPPHASRTFPQGSPLPMHRLDLEARRGFSPSSDGAFGLALIG